MEDWEARLTALETRLRDWNPRFEAELGKVFKERRLRGFLKKPRPADIEAAAEEARRRAGTEILAEFARFADELCDLYEKSLPQERAKIRARVGSADNVFELFWSYVEQSPERIRGPADEAKFRRGLFALVIDDLRAEIGLVDAVLGRLLVAAAAAGIDWKPHLLGAAELANPGMGGGGGCMKEYLLAYDNSAYFRREVAARLRDAARESLVVRARA